MITARQEKNKNRTIPLLFRLIRRTVLLAFLFLCSLMLLYIVGNYQLFLDTSQKIIIKTATFASTALIFISLAGCIESLVLIIQKKHERLYYSIHFVVIFFLGNLGFFTMLFFKSIDLLSDGM